MTNALRALVFLALAAPAAAQTLESAAVRLSAASAAFSHSMAERPRDPVRVAQANVDACRTGRELEGRPVRLVIEPLGQAAISATLRFTRCESAPNEFDKPSALRRFRDDATGWGLDMETEAGSDTTYVTLMYGRSDANATYWWSAGYLGPKPTKDVAEATVRFDMRKVSFRGESVISNVRLN